jgi:hypothetical protein
VLYALHDAWTYTNALKRQVQSLWLLIEQALAVNLLLFLALFGGMLLSAWQRGGLRLRWHRIRAWPRHFIPEGNDTLIFKSLPDLSPHAIPASAAMFCEIGATLLLMRRFTGKALKVDCTDDICRMEDQEGIGGGP